MTHEEACIVMHKSCICGKCKNKKSMSYEPVKDDKGVLIGIKDIKTACFCRTPMDKEGVDGKWGIHSITPSKTCEYFEEESTNEAE